METNLEKNLQTAIDTGIGKAGELLASYALTIAGALVVLLVGFIVAGLLSGWTRRAVSSFTHADETLARFLSKLVRYAVLVLVFVTVLTQFGVKTTSIIAALGAAGLAIGLALQGTLANIAAGIMLLVLRPMRVGEYIEADDISGTVQEIGLFTTELKRVDGLFVMVPNSMLWSRSITNYSRHKTRRFELVVGIGYKDDMKLAREKLLAMAKADSRVLAEPEPIAFVNSLDDSSVGIGLRLWTSTSDHIATVWDLTEAAKRTFDEAGISIPFPQREVHQRGISEISD